MEERPIVFETTEEEIEFMGLGDLILFIASAVSFLSLESHLAQDLNEEQREISIERMKKADHLLTLAKKRLDVWS